MKSERGVSVIEVLIVIAIILIIAGMAVPQLVRSRTIRAGSPRVVSLRTGADQVAPVVSAHLQAA